MEELWDFQVALVVRNLSANTGDMRLGYSPWVRKTIPWRRAWQPLQHSCLENPIDRGTWQATVHRVTKSQTRLKQLSTTRRGTFFLIRFI